MIKFRQLISITLLFTVLSCSPGIGPQPTENPDFAIVESTSSEFPILVNHKDGEHIALRFDPNTDTMKGVVYVYQNEKIYVELGEKGLPSKAFVNGKTIIFENYSGNMVDIGIVDESGETSIIREVVVDEYDFDAILNSSGRSRSDVATALQAAGLGLSIMGCALGAATPGAPLVILGCSSTLLSIITTIDANDDNWDIGASAFGIYANAIGCVTPGEPVGNVVACTSFFVDISTIIVSASQNHQNEFSQEIASIQGALDNGYGDIQVTLTWDTTADLDLYVTDPFGEKITYFNRSSVSGGQLDVDDIDGFGPENIFWLTGTAPIGGYTVEVDHFSGASPSNYTIRVQSLNQEKTYTGTVGAGQTITVTNFVPGEPLGRSAPIVKDNFTTYRPVK